LRSGRSRGRENEPNETFTRAERTEVEQTELPERRRERRSRGRQEKRAGNVCGERAKEKVEVRDSDGKGKQMAGQSLSESR
jgi:hypothetical protein